jgi:hypothetical protein
MGLLHKLRAWWDKDRTEIADEEAGMTQQERDVAEEDYESRKDDVRIRDQYASGANIATDFERDSEGPPKY